MIDKHRLTSAATNRARNRGGIVAALFVAALVFSAPARAQQNNMPSLALPPQSVMGNPNGVTDFVQAIPYSRLFLAFPITCPTHQFANVISASGSTCAQPAFSDIAGQAALVQLPSIANDTVLGNFSATNPTTPVAGSIPSCSGASQALNYNSSTHAFGCVTGTTLPAVAAFDTLCNPTNGSAVPIACQAGVLHSKDMGAVGNGSTDDTTALQNWINACQTNNLVCRLDAGTYKITTVLSCTAALTIEGVNLSVSVIQPTTSVSGITCTTTAPVTFRDFSVSYASAASTSTSAITLTASGAGNLNTGSRFDRIGMVNTGIGYNIGQAQYWTITNCLIQGIVTNGTGVVLDNSALTNPDTGDSTITGCTMTLPAAAANGVLISSFAGLRIANNKIIAAGTGGTAINLQLKNAIISSLLKIIGNSIEGITNGVILARAGTTGSFTNVVIANNEFEPGPGGAAVNNPTDANGVWLNTISITGNIIQGPTTSTSSFGYVVKAANGVQISGNLTTSNSSTNGFQAVASGGSSNCTIGPNGRGAGLFVAIDASCTTETTVVPGG